jgi:hypothetical protein
VATCESQHATEQNTSLVRLRLHVDTLQTQWTAPKAMLFLQALHNIQKSAGESGIRPIVVQVIFLPAAPTGASIGEWKHFP